LTTKSERAPRQRQRPNKRAPESPVGDPLVIKTIAQNESSVENLTQTKSNRQSQIDIQTDRQIDRHIDTQADR